MAAATIAINNGGTGVDLHQDVLQLLNTSSEKLLHPTSAHHAAALVSVKRFLDPLAHAVADVQELRRRENKRKRKRADANAELSSRVPQLREVYIEGFGVNQVWEQARRILDSATSEVERDLEAIAKQDPTAATGNRITSQLDKDGPEVTSGGEALESDPFLHSNSDDEFHTDHESLLDEATAELDGESEGISNDAEQSGHEYDDLSETEAMPQTYTPDTRGLNDGFFSIDDFNKQSHFLEQQDARGDTDVPSDEDEVDWDANPLAIPLPAQPKHNYQELGDSNREREDGPTFGSVDLDAASDEEDGDDIGLEDGMAGLENTNDITYADFFEPPPQRLSKSKRMRALPKTQPPHQADKKKDEKDINSDIQLAISDVRRDLLDSEDDISDQSHSDRDNTDENYGLKSSRATQKNFSSHEKKVAKLTSEIRRLESAAVSKRDWTLSGEASAADRPLNSLIPEDLEFERVGKPVPVITAEVSEEIEALIKRRIVDKEFDEIVRRRPEAVGAASSMRRGRVEIDDRKPSQGLADTYEAEHLKTTDPNYVDDRSATLKKQHGEITRLWKDVSAKLDILSNLHFKPKRTEINVQVVNDKPTISMEDARPGGGEAEAAIRLAPQEIYAPGEDGKDRLEVLDKAGLARSKEEITREEKARIRRREKARTKKQNGSVPTQQQQTEKKGKKGEKMQAKRNIIEELKKGGVKVIGKGGDVEEIEGGKKRRGDVEPRSHTYKL